MSSNPFQGPEYDKRCKRKKDDERKRKRRGEDERHQKNNRPGGCVIVVDKTPQDKEKYAHGYNPSFYERIDDRNPVDDELIGIEQQEAENDKREERFFVIVSDKSNNVHTFYCTQK